MGRLTDIFLEPAEAKTSAKAVPEKQKQDNELELLLIPISEEDKQTYLEQQYRFSQVANGSDRIVVGRLDMESLDKLAEELQLKNKLYIPSPRFIASLKPFLDTSCNTTLAFNDVQKEYDRICHERNYHRVSREHLEIRKEDETYILRNLTLGRNGNGGIPTGMSSIMVYDPEKSSSIEVENEIVLKEGMIINFGYPPSPLVKYPVRLEVVLRNFQKGKRSETSKIAPFYE